MKSMTPTLILLALLALIPGALLAAGTPVTAAPTVAAASPAVPPSLDDFFASLAGGASNRSQASELPAISASTTCQSAADCPNGWLCCYPCGIPDCNFVCMKVKRCPLFP